MNDIIEIEHGGQTLKIETSFVLSLLKIDEKTHNKDYYVFAKVISEIQKYRFLIKDKFDWTLAVRVPQVHDILYTIFKTQIMGKCSVLHLTYSEVDNEYQLKNVIYTPPNQERK